MSHACELAVKYPHAHWNNSTCSSNISSSKGKDNFSGVSMVTTCLTKPKWQQNFRSRTEMCHNLKLWHVKV